MRLVIEKSACLDFEQKLQGKKINKFQIFYSAYFLEAYTSRFIVKRLIQYLNYSLYALL